MSGRNCDSFHGLKIHQRYVLLGRILSKVTCNTCIPQIIGTNTNTGQMKYPWTQGLEMRPTWFAVQILVSDWSDTQTCNLLVLQHMSGLNLDMNWKWGRKVSLFPYFTWTWTKNKTTIKRYNRDRALTGRTKDYSVNVLIYSTRTYTYPFMSFLIHDKPRKYHIQFTCGQNTGGLLLLKCIFIHLGSTIGL